MGSDALSFRGAVFAASFAFGDGAAVVGSGLSRPAARRSSLASPWLEFQIASAAGALSTPSMKGLGALPLPWAIVAIARPEATDLSIASTPPPSSRSLASSSRCLISSQFVRLPPNLSCFMRTSTKLPLRRSPASTNFSSPSFKDCSGGLSCSGAQKPRSNSCTVPPPYWPLGIVPSKSP